MGWVGVTYDCLPFSTRENTNAPKSLHTKLTEIRCCNFNTKDKFDKSSQFLFNSHKYVYIIVKKNL